MLFRATLTALCLLLCSACGWVWVLSYQYMPTLNFEPLEGEGWKILLPPPKWVSDYKATLLPQYFTVTQVNVLSRSSHNLFYATYTIDENKEIAVFTCFFDSFHIARTITYQSNDYPAIEYRDNKGTCTKYNKSEIFIAINIVNVDFDNTSVYILKNTRKIQGIETRFSRFPFYGERLPPAVYNLSSQEVIREKQHEIVVGKPWKNSTFAFRFEDMTCADYEDAVFVIDGLSENGRKLPPLKVHMNYFDFSAVPEYTGKKQP
jgi:hypothetical protein